MISRRPTVVALPQVSMQAHGHKDKVKTRSALHETSVVTRPGKHTKSYGKSPSFIGKSTINGLFSRAMLNYQCFKTWKSRSVS